MKRLNAQVFLFTSFTLMIVLLSQISPGMADSNFEWGLEEGKYHYHVSVSSEGWQTYELDYDAYIQISEIPQILENAENWGDTIYIDELPLNRFYANGTSGANFDFYAVLIGNWTELTRIYESSPYFANYLMGISLTEHPNITMIDTEQVWGFIIHLDYVPEVSYDHYEFRFSKKDGVMESYIEERIMPYGNEINRTREYIRYEPLQLGVIAVAAAAGGLVIIAAVIVYRRRSM